MHKYVMPDFDVLEIAKQQLEKLDHMTEESLYSIWKENDNSTIQFENGVAQDLKYTGNNNLAEKMIFRLRNSPDICYFWNAIDLNNRVRLLCSVGIQYWTLGIDFFVWLGNTHCKWHKGRLEKTTIATYFDASDDQKKKWIEEYVVLMRDFVESLD